MTLRKDGVAVDLTGKVAQVVEVMPAALAGSLDFSITDPTGGQMLLTCPWSDQWPRGTGALVQIRLRLGGLSDAFPVIWLDLQ